MKFNWGTKIALLYSIFVAFILFMVYLSFGQKYDLVTKDYYAEEIEYQGKIDSKERAKGLEQSLKCIIEKSQLKIVFPQKDVSIKGVINCFRPSDKNKDFEIDIDPTDGVQIIPINKFIKGKYLIKVNWTVNEIDYYKEQVIIIP